VPASLAARALLGPGFLAWLWVAGASSSALALLSRGKLHGPEVAVVLFFPLAGLVMVALSLRSGWRELRLLRDGKLALGTLIAKEPTRVSVNKRRVMRMRFAIQTDRGGRQEVVVETQLTAAIEDEPRERILYDPRKPALAVPWDLLRCRPRLGVAGALEPAGWWVALLVLAPPALAVLCHALALRWGAG
jgi:hypothetical protein